MVDSYRIKIPASIVAVTYSKLFQNEKVKKLIIAAVDKKDLKAALIIDHLYDKLGQEDVDEMLNQENSLEKKAIDMLTLYNAKKALELLTAIAKKAVDMKAKVSTLLNEGGFNDANIGKLSYIMQQVRDYLSECNKFKKIKYLTNHNKSPEIKNAISLLNKIKNSIQGQIYHRNEEITNDIALIVKNIEQVNARQINPYRKRLNIYLKELKLIRKASILYK